MPLNYKLPFTYNNVVGTFEGLQQRSTDFIRRNPLVVGSVAGFTTAGGIAGLVAVARRRSKKRSASSSKRKRRTSKRYYKTSKRRHKHRSGPKARLRYHTHRRTKGVHYTKNGQPYVIMASGKARFISKRGAKASKKRKGGRY